jgi:hypothetical protein
MANELVKTGLGHAVVLDLPISSVAIAVLKKTNNAGFAADQFFKASISNEHTRRAYGRIVSRFLIWCDEYTEGPPPRNVRGCACSAVGKGTNPTITKQRQAAKS